MLSVQVMFMFLSFARKWTGMDRAVNVYKNLCIATDFRCPEGREIVQICNATMDLGCGLPDQGLVHKYYLVCLLGVWMVDNDTDAVLNNLNYCSILKTSCVLAWELSDRDRFSSELERLIS